MNERNFGYKKWGGGFDLRRCGGKDELIEFQPYLTYNLSGPWYIFGGFSIDTEDRKFIQTGFWYIKQFGKLSFTADIRQWWAASGEKSFFDPFIQLLHPLPLPFNTHDERLYGGVEMEYIHWWQTDHKGYMLGPVGGFNVTKNISVFTRFSRDWYVAEKTSVTDRVRVGISISF